MPFWVLDTVAAIPEGLIRGRFQDHGAGLHRTLKALVQTFIHPDVHVVCVLPQMFRILVRRRWASHHNDSILAEGHLGMHEPAVRCCVTTALTEAERRGEPDQRTLQVFV
jgi:hypothetical protein